MKCPYDGKTVCACLEAKDPKAFACIKCNIYKKFVSDKEDPIDGYKTIGCLFVGICILIVFGLTAYKIIEGFQIRQDNPVEQFNPKN